MNNRNYRGGGGRGGGTKDFKADPIKQFLISRGSARDRAVELCCAGKIALSDIPLYTDKLTILHFGQLEIDPKVDAEIMRIAVRLQRKSNKEQQEETEETAGDLCETCADQTPCQPLPGERPVYDCKKYYNIDDATADAAYQQQRESEEQQQAEDSSNASQQRESGDDPEPSGNPVYVCGTCSKEYKTVQGLERHRDKVHAVPEEK